MWSSYGKNALSPIEHHLIQTYLTERDGKVLEAGTGSGRIAFHVENLGFASVDAFDYLDEMIQSANHLAGELRSNVRFQVADAVNLAGYPANAYDYTIYLQQLLCFIPRTLLPAALEECYRVLKPGGIAVFSVLNFAGRSYNPALSRLVNLMRRLYGEPVHPYELPWLKLSGRLNWRLLGRNQARVRWFLPQQIRQLLESAGYKILALGTAGEILQQPNHSPIGLYIVCTK